MPRFTFVFRGEERSGEFDASTTLLEAAQSLDVPIVSTCGGGPSCTDCRCKILVGYEQLDKPEYEERNLMGSVSHITKIRLACQTRSRGDLKVEPLRLKGDTLRVPKAKQGPLGRKQDPTTTGGREGRGGDRAARARTSPARRSRDETKERPRQADRERTNAKTASTQAGNGDQPRSRRRRRRQRRHRNRGSSRNDSKPTDPTP